MAAFDITKSPVKIIVAAVLIWLILMAIQFSYLIMQRRRPSFAEFIRGSLSVTVVAIVVAVTLLLLNWLQSFTS